MTAATRPDRPIRGELAPTEAELAAEEGREYETAEQLLPRIRAELTTRKPDKKPGHSGPKRRRASTTKLTPDSRQAERGRQSARGEPIHGRCESRIIGAAP